MYSKYEITFCKGTAPKPNCGMSKKRIPGFGIKSEMIKTKTHTNEPHA